MSPTILFNEQDLLDKLMPPTLVDDLLVQDSVAMLVSHPGVGKSFIALDLALSIAAGLPQWLGFPLHAHDAVVYVIGEGSGRFSLRVRAWKIHNKVNWALPFYWTNGPVNLLDEDEVAGFTLAIAEVRPALIVFDTLSRCLPGAEENLQAEMSQAVAAMDAIRAASPMSVVLLLHHLNASGTRERGSTVVGGAVDTVLTLKPMQSQQGQSRPIALGTSKQKDLETLAEPLVLVSRVIDTRMVEETGRPATSLVWVRGTDKKIASLIEQEDRFAERAADILTYVGENPGVVKVKVATMVGGRYAEVLKVIDRLIQTGKLVAKARGTAHRLWLSPPVPIPPTSKSVGGREQLDGVENEDLTNLVEEQREQMVVREQLRVAPRRLGMFAPRREPVEWEADHDY